MTADPRAVALTIAAAHAAADKLAEDIVAIDVSNHLVLTDVFLLCSATNDRAVRAVVDGIEEALLHPSTAPDAFTATAITAGLAMFALALVAIHARRTRSTGDGSITPPS